MIVVTVTMIIIAAMIAMTVVVPVAMIVVVVLHRCRLGQSHQREDDHGGQVQGCGVVEEIVRVGVVQGSSG